MVETRTLNKEPWDWAEPHSPTVPYTVTLSKAAKRTTVLARRRFLDARLWDRLTTHKDGRVWNGCEAAAGIDRGCRLTLDGGPVKSHSWERRDPSRSPDHLSVPDAHCANLFMKWGNDMLVKGLDRQAATSILIDGYPCRKVEQILRRRHGWAMKNLVQGLQLYCDLAGWPR